MTITAPNERIRTLALRQKPRVATIAGEKRYVLADGDRAVLGPIAQRRKPMLRRPAKDHKHHVHPHIEMDVPTLEQQIGSIANNLRTSFGMPPLAKRRWYHKLRDGFMNREVHTAIQHAALDVVIIALAVTAVQLGAWLLVKVWF